ncbi:WD40 repeat domain-containing protein [Streptomyces sp. NPDC013187]|uniref:WD40 repeat domain-containing protein n=1 Tax=Streptomyces sp. NPDC013187 TaxID=3364865 RepID=UPI0036CA4069
MNPDGRTLATAGYDGTVRLWSIGERRATADLTGHTDAVPGVAFGPDGRTLATIAGGATPEQRLWSLDTDHVARLICQDSNTHHWLQLVADSSAAKAACA